LRHRRRALIALSLGIIGVVAVAPIVGSINWCIGWAVFGASAVFLGLGLFAEID
jgi:hypothetical protein